MNNQIPRIIYQTSPRWFAISKPSGWALGARGSGNSVERFLTPIVGERRLLFPVEVDSRISAVSLVATDRGMQAQFEKFKVRGELESWYNVVVKGACEKVKVDEYGVDIMSCEEDGEGLVQVRLCSDHSLSFKKLNALFDERIDDFKVNNYKLVFPDPLNPSENEICISLPS